MGGTNRVLAAVGVLMVFAVCALGQTGRSWVEKPVKEAEKMLTDSPWAQTQTDTDTTELFYSPTKPGSSSIGQGAQIRATIPDQQAINNNRADRGATNGAVAVNYYVRLFSAKPIREAISRVVLLNQIEPRPEVIEMMQTLVDRDFSKYIVITVSYDATDGRFLAPSIKAFASARAETLRYNTYLERRDGKRIYLMDYRAPQDDGLGAKFVFPRVVDGQEFLTAGSGTVRFFSEISTVKLNVKYKLSDMTFAGKLEY